MPFDRTESPAPREIFIREIEERIISGKLAIGEKLPTERELEAQTGISKSVIHFALKDLEKIGFIRIVPRQGAYVADYARSGSFDILGEILRYHGGRLSYKMSVDIVEMRNAIEGAALVKLAANHTDEDIAQLKITLDELRDAKVKDMSLTELAEITSKFHYQVCKLSGNDMFALVMNSFAPISTVLWKSCAAFWGAEGFLEQDEKILEMIKHGEGEAAHKYIEDIFAQYLAAFNSTEGCSYPAKDGPDA